MLCSCFQKATLPVDVPADKMPAGADQDKLLMVADISDRMSSSTEPTPTVLSCCKHPTESACLPADKLLCVDLGRWNMLVRVYMTSIHNKAVRLPVTRQRVQTPHMHLQTQQASKQELQAGVL